MNDEHALSARLRAATRSAHDRVERGPMMQRLLAGRLPLADYRRLLAQFQALYGALETALAGQSGNPQVTRLCPPALRRGQAIAEDLGYLVTCPPQTDTGPLVPATLAYVVRLQHLAQHDLPRLLAHAYVRYLGDLYGGQMLGRRLRQQHALAAGLGTRFYEFGDASRVRDLILDFRAALDAFPLSPAQSDALVAEACEAFDRHGQIFEQLLQESDSAAAE
jgi:heme oxygenase (biliverdin-producing, ferredoxin)